MKTDVQRNNSKRELVAAKTASISTRTSQRRRRTLRIWESESPPPFTSTPTSDLAIASFARFTTFSRTTIVALRAVPDDHTILLLTPVVAHPGTSTSYGDNVDPFETLGRAVSGHHRRVRHVPYIPGLPPSDAHMIFLRKASAVTVVCCEPTSSLRAVSQLRDQPESAAVKLFHAQLRFLKTVHQALCSFQGVSHELPAVPLTVASIGPRGCLFDQGKCLESFEMVTYCPYQNQAFKDLANLLYECPI